MRILPIVGQKGGTGKTTTVMNLAAVTSKDARVLVIDVDPQQSTTWWAQKAGESLPYDFAPNVDPRALSRMRDLPYDVVFVDTPGTLDNVDVLTTVLDQADFAIVPMTPEPLNVQPLQRTIEQHIQPRNLPYRILLNRIDRRRHGQIEDWEALVDNGLKLPRFRASIRMSAAISDAPLRGKVVTAYNDTRANAAAIFDYTSVGLELTSIWAHGGE